MRTAIGLYTLCRAVAGLSAQDTVPAAATNAKNLVHQHPFIADGEPEIQFNMVLHERDVSRVGAVSAQRCSEHRARRYSGKAAGVTVPECRAFFSRQWESKGDNQTPRNVQTTGS